MDYYVPPVVEQSIHASAHKTATFSFTQALDCAQYGGSDYQNAIRVERGITLERALEIAANDPRIHYFCFTKGYCMVLPVPPEQIVNETTDPLNLISDITYRKDEDGSIGRGGCRTFHRGDVVFFAKEGQWLGTAPGLADTYSKKE